MRFLKGISDPTNMEPPSESLMEIVLARQPDAGYTSEESR
jgi:hypothetical protein